MCRRFLEKGVVVDDAQAACAVSAAAGRKRAVDAGRPRKGSTQGRPRPARAPAPGACPARSEAGSRRHFSMALEASGRLRTAPGNQASRRGPMAAKLALKAERAPVQAYCSSSTTSHVDLDRIIAAKGELQPVEPHRTAPCRTRGCRSRVWFRASRPGSNTWAMQPREAAHEIVAHLHEAWRTAQKPG